MKKSSVQVVILVVLITALGVVGFLFLRSGEDKKKPDPKATAEADEATTTVASTGAGDLRDKKKEWEAILTGATGSVETVARGPAPLGVKQDLYEAWGRRGKERPGAPDPMSDTQLALGELYIGLSEAFTDELRKAERKSPLPSLGTFDIEVARADPFRRLDLGGSWAPVPVTDEPPEDVPPPNGNGAPIPIPIPDVPPPDIAGTIPLLPPVASPTEQLFSGFGGSGIPRVRTPVQDTGPRPTIARPPSRPQLNLRVAGTVVATDGRSSAILTDGASSTFLVSEGHSFTAGGQQFRVLSVGRNMVEVESAQRRISITSSGIGGSAP